MYRWCFVACLSLSSLSGSTSFVHQMGARGPQPGFGTGASSSQVTMEGGEFFGLACVVLRHLPPIQTLSVPFPHSSHSTFATITPPTPFRCSLFAVNFSLFPFSLAFDLMSCACVRLPVVRGAVCRVSGAPMPHSAGMDLLQEMALAEDTARATGTPRARTSSAGENRW
jgi:hypothetical protein